MWFGLAFLIKCVIKLIVELFKIFAGRNELSEFNDLITNIPRFVLNFST